MRILLVQTSWLGDNILTTPLVRNLAAAGEVDVLTLPRWAEIYRGNPAVKEIIIFDKRGVHRGISGIRKIAGVLKSRRYDAAVLAQKWFRVAVIAAMAKIPVRIGFADAPAKIFYTHRVDYPRHKHELERLLELARPLGIEPQVCPPELHPQEPNFAWAETVLNGIRKPTVALAPGSAWETKRYPHFRRVAEELIRRGVGVFVVGTEAESNLLDEISAAGAVKVVSASILDTAALFAKVSAVVANDSGAGHIASAMGTPVVSIFGPTVPQQGFYPWGERVKIVQVDLDCRPCDPHGPRKCPRGHHNCMRLIPPEMVVDAVMEIIEEKK